MEPLLDCVLLGIGGMMPMPFRALTSLVVRREGWNYLFDAGEGAQIGLKASRAGIKNLKLLAITHLHADHCLGIPGILMLRAQIDEPGPLTIVGPPGIGNFVKITRETLGYYLNFPINFIEWSPTSNEIAYQDENIKLLWKVLDHSVFCLGYRLEEHVRPGRFLVDKAAELQIPMGPLWGELQKGRIIHLQNGKEILPEMVLGQPRRGRSISYIVDTRACEAIQALCQDCDFTFIESMFAQEMQEEARIKGHLTTIEAAQLTRAAKVKNTILVHISPRYRNSDLQNLLLEAQSVNPAVQIGVARNFYDVELQEE